MQRYLAGLCLFLPTLCFGDSAGLADDHIGGVALSAGPDSMLLGLLIGAMAFTVLMNTMCWVATRERSFFVGAIYVASLIYVVSIISGIHLQLLWPQSPETQLAVRMSAWLMTFLCFSLTCKSFLALGEFEPRISASLDMTALLGVLVIAAIVINPTWSHPLGWLYGALVLLVTGVACISKVLDQYPPSYWFSLAWVLVSGLYAFLVGVDMFDLTGPLMEFGVITGAVTQSLVITYGLVYRLSMMHRQVLNYQATLEAAVTKRTDELAEMAEALKESNEALMHASRTDPLTGCRNRRYLDEMAGMLFRDAARTQSPLSLLVFDADHFKAINDNFGHDMGDQALKIIAQGLHENAKRPMDIVARFGGEEFVLVLPSTPLDGATRVAHRIRQWLKESPVMVPGEGAFCVTMSVGVVSGIPAGSESVDEYFKQADTLVYQAKTSGRDRVCFSWAGVDEFGTETVEQSDEAMRVACR